MDVLVLCVGERGAREDEKGAGGYGAVVVFFPLANGGGRVGEQGADDGVALPDLEDAALLADADAFVGDALAGLSAGHDEGQIFGHDDVELAVVKGEGDLAEVVLDEAPIDAFLAQVGRQMDNIQAGELDIGVAE